MISMYSDGHRYRTYLAGRSRGILELDRYTVPIRLESWFEGYLHATLWINQWTITWDCSEWQLMIQSHSYFSNMRPDHALKRPQEKSLWNIRKIWARYNSLPPSPPICVSESTVTNCTWRSRKRNPVLVKIEVCISAVFRVRKPWAMRDCLVVYEWD